MGVVQPIAPEAGAEQVRVLVLEPQELFRESLGSLLHMQLGLAVVASCGNAQAVPALARTCKPDVLVLDCARHSECLDLLRQLNDLGVDGKVVLLSASPQPDEITSALSLGVRAVVPKSESAEGLVHSIHSVARGDYWLDRESIAGLIQTLAEGEKRPSPPANKYGLTRRERQVLAAILDGCSNPEIAVLLSLSESTVKHHVSKIFGKVGVTGRVELALLARNDGEAFERDSDSARSY